MRSPLFALCLTTSALVAQPPGYYASVDTSSASALRSTLHEVIDDHVKIPYTSSGFPDTWDVLERAWENPSNSGQIVDVYRNQAISKSQRGSGFNREHMWPSSLGFPNDGGTNYPFSDCFLLALSTPAYNSARSNKPYDTCAVGCAEFTTLSTNGIGGGSGIYPGNSNWTSGSFTSGRWEVWRERRGDVARAMFYVDLRYEGGTHNLTGAAEPQLTLTDLQSQITSSSSNQSLAYHGILSTLLAWHYADPVDATEIQRANVIASFQGNRNPFVDHPEWVDIVYGSSPPGPPPASGQFITYGTGCGVMGMAAPVYSATGTPDVGQTIQLFLFGAPANSPTSLSLGLSALNLPLDPFGFPGCVSLVQGIASVNLPSGPFGLVTLGFPIPDQASLVGVSLFSQWLALDLTAAGLAASGGIEIEFGSQ